MTVITIESDVKRNGLLVNVYDWVISADLPHHWDYPFEIMETRQRPEEIYTHRTDVSHWEKYGRLIQIQINHIRMFSTSTIKKRQCEALRCQSRVKRIHIEFSTPYWGIWTCLLKIWIEHWRTSQECKRMPPAVYEKSKLARCWYKLLIDQGMGPKFRGKHIRNQKWNTLRGIS